MSPVLFDSEIIFNKTVNNSVFLMRLSAMPLRKEIVPGQFVMVQTSSTGFPLLRRPFSICAAERDFIEILFHVKGIGTQQMSQLSSGDKISIMGPLGRGFVFSEQIKKIYILAGGIGIAPLLFLMNRLSQTKIDVFIGAESEDKVLKPEKFGIKVGSVHIATDDGSMGYRGFVTELFNDFMEKSTSSEEVEKSCICACGPLPMLKNVSKLSEKFNMQCYVSVETKMACGSGACLGCAVEINQPGHNNLYNRVCYDGPVFDIKNINLNSLAL